MLRVLAGILGGPPEASRRLLASAMGPEGRRPGIWCERSLVVAATGPEPPGGQAVPGCLLDGELHDGPTENELGAAFARRGRSVLEGARGDFTVFLWHSARGTGCLARDPLGGRPLFLHRFAGRLAFASEVSLLLRLLTRTPGPDELAVAAWLGRGIHPRGRTLFEGIEPLAPGSLLVLDGRADPAPFWRPRHHEPAAVSRPEAADRLLEGVHRAVRRRLPDEAQAGVMLSGGLDSSVVAAVAAQATGPGGVRAYSAVFPQHPDVDESVVAESMAAHARLPWVRGSVEGGSALESALDYQRRWGVPAPSPNRFFDQLILRRAADDGAAIVLDGEGGDELFGASPFLVADLLAAGRPARAIGLAQDLASEYAPHGHLVARVLLRYGVRGLLPAALHAALRSSRDSGRRAPAWFRPRTAELLHAAHDDWEWKRLDGPRWWSWLAHTLTAGREAAGASTHLGREAAAAGLQARQPFLDQELVELVLGTPPQLSFDRRLDRPLLRDGARGLIPEPVRSRTEKARFNSVQNDAIALADGDRVRRLLGAPDARVNAYASRDALRDGPLRAMGSHTRGQAGGWTMAIWRLVTLECWLRELEAPGFAGRELAAGGFEPARVAMWA